MWGELPACPPQSDFISPMLARPRTSALQHEVAVRTESPAAPGDFLQAGGLVVSWADWGTVEWLSIPKAWNQGLFGVNSMLDEKLLTKIRVEPGSKVRLKDFDPGWAQSPDIEAAGKKLVKARAEEVLEQ